MVVGLLVLFANPAHAEHQDFVGHEPAQCDILDFYGPLEGKIIGTSLPISSEIRVTFNQFGCRITGELDIMSSRFAGTGPFYGIVDGNVLRFTVTEKLLTLLGTSISQG